MKRKKILITGSCGFILGNFVRQAFYSKKPYNIVSIDNPKEPNSIYKNSDHKFYIADICDKQILNTIFQTERPEVVVHGASLSSGTPHEMINTNIQGAQNVIEACLSVDAKLIYLSSSGVYGEQKTENDPRFKESDQIPQIPYDLEMATKRGAESIIQMKREKALRANILRLSNNYGPWQQSYKLIPQIIHKIIKDEKILLHGQGQHVRDWAHVYDTCAAIFKVIDAGIDGEIYNIGTNQSFSNLEVFQIICNAMGKGHSLVGFDSAKTSVFRHEADNSKIKALGWVPEYKFRDGIAHTVSWYSNNQFFLGM